MPIRWSASSAFPRPSRAARHCSSSSPSGEFRSAFTSSTTPEPLPPADSAASIGSRTSLRGTPASTTGGRSRDSIRWRSSGRRWRGISTSGRASARGFGDARQPRGGDDQEGRRNQPQPAAVHQKSLRSKRHIATASSAPANATVPRAGGRGRRAPTDRSRRRRPGVGELPQRRHHRGDPGEERAANPRPMRSRIMLRCVARSPRTMSDAPAAAESAALRTQPSPPASPRTRSRRPRRRAPPESTGHPVPARSSRPAPGPGPRRRRPLRPAPA